MLHLHISQGQWQSCAWPVEGIVWLHKTDIHESVITFAGLCSPRQALTPLAIDPSGQAGATTLDHWWEIVHILRLKLVDLGALCHWTPRSDERRFRETLRGLQSSAVDRSFGYASEDTVRRGSSAQDCASPTIGMRLLEKQCFEQGQWE